MADTALSYLVCLTIGPAFLSAAIYLCLARILVVYGVTISRFSPRTYTITFMTCDFISLLLQAVGGAIADTADNHSLEQMGINIMIAGLAWQVASLLLFIVCCGEYAWRVWRSWVPTAAGSHPLRESRMFKAFLGGERSCHVRETKSKMLTCLPSTCSSNNNHFHPLLLPCRGVEPGLQWPSGKQRAHLHGFGGRHDHYCYCFIDRLPSWLVVRWAVGGCEFCSSRQEGA